MNEQFPEKNLLHVVCFTLCLLCAQSIHAQEDSIFQFEFISKEPELFSNVVSQFLQDKKGFIWITTAYGLKRYDGNFFKRYYYNPNDSNTILPGSYSAIKEDSRGILWIASDNHGFYSFDPSTEKFTAFHAFPGKNNSLSDDDINGLQIDSNGMIWIGSQEGLNAYDPKTKNFRLFLHRNGDPSTISDNNISGICCDGQDQLWVSYYSTGGADCFDTHTGRVIMHFDFDSISHTKQSQPAIINGISKGRDGNIWIATQGMGLFQYNVISKKMTHFLHAASQPYSLRSNNVYYGFENHDGNIWTVTEKGGIDFYDRLAGKFFHGDFKSSNYGKPGHPCMIEDRSGKLWMGLENGRIITCNPPYKIFRNVRYEQKGYSLLKSNNVYTFFRTREGKLLVASLGAVNEYDRMNQKLIPFPDKKNEKIDFGDGDIWRIYQDDKGICWFCIDSGLISYDPQTGKHHYYKHDPHDPYSHNGFNVTDIKQDSKGRYWITTWQGGLEAFDPGSGKFRAFKVNSSANSISSNSMGGIFESSQGTLYIGNWNGGLITFNPDNETFKNYLHKAGDPNTPGGDGFAFIETKPGIIWFCTTGSGLNVFDEKKKKFRYFTMQDGLCDNNIQSIVKDNSGNIWLGTNDGISCFAPPDNPFDPETKIQFHNYDMSDGLPGNQNEFFGSYKDTDGTLFFATPNNGFYHFNPAELKNNSFIPPVYIIGFSLFNKSVTPNDSSGLFSSLIEQTKEISLSYQQNVISFSFAALNYIHPEKNRYAYQLENFDKDWIYTNASKPFADYTNLDPGEYIFKVKGSNNDGLWNDVPATIKLIITPPFWQTWWFRILIVMAIAGIVYAIYRYRVRQVIRLQTIRNNIASDLHDEIGSTLNSISILSSVAKQQAGKSLPALDKIGENSRKIVEAMNDIVWTINPENDSFEKILVRMRSFAHQVMKGKQIEFRFDADENLNDLSLPMQTRKNFYLIFKEATINIAKYSSASHANFAVTRNDQQIQLMIRDSGVGFDIDKNSSGNGIKNMRRRANEINAALNIESTAGEGTSIELTLKI